MKLTQSSTIVFVGCCGLITLLTGCASIMCGPNQEVKFDSRPEGAQVLVYDARGDIIFQQPTPCVARLARRDPDTMEGGTYVALVRKEGFEPVQIPLNGLVNRAYTANILNGGIGYAVDPMTGSMWTLTPQGMDPKTVTERVGFFKDEGFLILLREEGATDTTLKAAAN